MIQSEHGRSSEKILNLYSLVKELFNVVFAGPHRPNSVDKFSRRVRVSGLGLKQPTDPDSTLLHERLNRLFDSAARSWRPWISKECQLLREVNAEGLEQPVSFSSSFVVPQLRVVNLTVVFRRVKACH